MRILLTNDDGISSPGIKLLAAALRNAGHKVYVVAPHSNRSGSSHSILFLRGPLKIKKVEEDTWLCSGNPVDCVITALLGGIAEINCLSGENTKIIAEKAPDLILSGINSGANLGTDIVFSGTAAAARQGSFYGIPSVALSLVENNNVWHWEPVISYITEKLDEITGFWKAGTFVNVNFPNTGKKPSALVPSFPSMRYYNDRIIAYSAPNGKMYSFSKTGQTTTPDGNFKAAQGSDWDEVLKGNAAITVVMSQPVAYKTSD
jgi:5'-nucleotidase